MINFTCPFTKSEIIPKAVGNYIRYATKKHNITSDDLKYKLYIGKYGEYLCSKEGIYEYYVTKKYSIPMFKKEFGMNAKILFFFIRKSIIKLIQIFLFSLAYLQSLQRFLLL